MTIIDYGLGNIRAFANVYKKLNIPVKIATNTDDVKKATKLILPGIGAFDHAIQQFDQSGMRPVLNEMVLHHRVPVLGICVGMQMLACSSEEGKLPGLGWIDAKVNKFDISSFKQPECVPHMGWNDVKQSKNNVLFNGLGNDSRFYFLHSYYIHCKNNEDVIAVTDYGGKFACAVNSGNIFGVQFHPEKSHQWGILLLENFAKL